jgi:hypothetical protein
MRLMQKNRVDWPIHEVNNAWLSFPVFREMRMLLPNCGADGSTDA